MMTVSLLKQYPEEANIVGRILAGYTDVECALMNLVAAAIGDLSFPRFFIFQLIGIMPPISSHTEH